MSAKQEAMENFTEEKDKSGKVIKRFTVVKGVTFELAADSKSTSREMLQSVDGNLWNNMATAANTSNIKSMGINFANYGLNESGNMGTHYKGNAMDVGWMAGYSTGGVIDKKNPQNSVPEIEFPASGESGLIWLLKTPVSQLTTAQQRRREAILNSGNASATILDHDDHGHFASSGRYLK